MSLKNSLLLLMLFSCTFTLHATTSPPSSIPLPYPVDMVDLLGQMFMKLSITLKVVVGGAVAFILVTKCLPWFGISLGGEKIKDFLQDKKADKKVTTKKQKPFYIVPERSRKMTNEEIKNFYTSREIDLKGLTDSSAFK